MNYVILAAGIGRSMQKYGAKILLPYKNKKLIDHQIKTIEKFDRDARIHIVLGFKANQVIDHINKKKYDCSVVVNTLYDLSGQSESLKIGLMSCFRNDTYILHGDIAFNKAALEVDGPTIPVSHEKDYLSVGITHQDGKVLNLSYGIKEKWGQMFFITKEHLDFVKTSVSNLKQNRQTYEFINKIMEKIPFKIHNSKQIKIEELKR